MLDLKFFETFHLSDKGFDTHVADLVDTFNLVVNDGRPPTESIAIKIGYLKQITDALFSACHEEINHARSNPEYVETAWERVSMVREILLNPDEPHAPYLIQEGALLPERGTIWQQLGTHIERELSHLKLSTNALIEAKANLGQRAGYFGKPPRNG